uniref:Uncharacterized protein n=1 Tax=Ixodes ricinus TaxID=34613 RepID=A0A6B0V3I6_IXORI
MGLFRLLRFTLEGCFFFGLLFLCFGSGDSDLSRFCFLAEEEEEVFFFLGASGVGLLLLTTSFSGFFFFFVFCSGSGELSESGTRLYCLCASEAACASLALRSGSRELPSTKKGLMPSASFSFWFFSTFASAIWWLSFTMGRPASSLGTPKSKRWACCWSIWRSSSTLESISSWLYPCSSIISCSSRHLISSLRLRSWSRISWFALRFIWASSRWMSSSVL